MYYVITNTGVVAAKSLKALKLRTGYTMDDSQFTVYGADKITHLAEQKDIEFVRDCSKMENLMFASFFKKDNSVKFLSIFIFIFQFLFFFIMNSKIGGLYGFFGN